MARTPTFGSRFDNSPLWNMPGPELRKSSITSKLCKSLITATAPPAVDDAAHAQQVLRHILRDRILDVAERTPPPVEEQMIFVPVRFLREIDQPESLRFKPQLKPDDPSSPQAAKIMEFDRDLANVREKRVRQSIKQRHLGALDVDLHQIDLRDSLLLREHVEPHSGHLDLVIVLAGANER
ncbi:hypothetical protein AB3X94_41585 [Paraburkholderia sp. BR10923]|uniref:hypothetical protein n=1 Tax=Paraburkholderia sp. BR10923 TaxID=3236992 RepID=UPI0034CD37E2